MHDCDHRERMFSEDIVATLNGMEDRPWGGFKDGAGMSKWSLASMLKPFEVSPRLVRVEEVVRRGYERADFEDLWERYPPQTDTRYTVHSTWLGHMDDVTGNSSAGEGDGDDPAARERLDWSLVLDRVRAVLDGRPRADVATVCRITGNAYAGETVAAALAEIRRVEP